MWPYTEDELGWLNRPPAPIAPTTSIRFEPVSPELVAYHIARGRRLRAEAIGRFAARAAGALRRLPGRWSAPAGRRAQADGYEAMAHLLRTPLTSIRSSSEILRDNPDLPRDQRARFVDVIVQESERLTRAIDRVLAHSSPPCSARAGRT